MDIDRQRLGEHSPCLLLNEISQGDSSIFSSATAPFLDKPLPFRVLPVPARCAAGAAPYLPGSDRSGAAALRTSAPDGDGDSAAEPPPGALGTSTGSGGLDPAEVLCCYGDAASAAAALRQLNSTVQYVPYCGALSPRSALQLVRQYDVVADCSDNVPTRYLVNDACVLAGKPLVSGSALRLEGQLVVYNYQGGPCYRCLFPKPPPPETVTNCADGGVLGVVPGIVGCIQALEVLKIVSGMGSSFSRFMLMFDAQEGRFRNIRLRPKRPDCAVCGDNPSVTCLQDYEAFCGSSATDKCRTLHLLSSKDRISVEEYKKLLDEQIPHVLLDVRPQVEVDICRLEHAVHIPLSKLEEKDEEYLKYLEKRICEEKQRTDGQTSFPVYVVCKLGNDSQKAVRILQELPDKAFGPVLARDIKGGLMSWASRIDPTFPQY
ncbi:adenylyltransferase and sulfurtransferase MOCS3 [Meleagris gallopavo]|nr:adenylyltransferase and sulfurtransferase MOCS3 [Meleagris gallopavo]